MTKVTVAILSYRRREVLELVIESVLDQIWPEIELIVVDNGSGDELTSFLRKRYPSVRLIALSANEGTAARNHAIREAAGDLIVMLDNDVYFEDARGIERMVEAFERRPEAGSVVFRVRHPSTGALNLRDWCHPKPPDWENEEFETHYITEGAAAFRREVFDSVEPYWPLLFIGHEGFDLGLRLIDAGYRIWYVPAVRVLHMASLETRPDWRPFYFYSRNLLAIAARDLPWLRGAA